MKITFLGLSSFLIENSSGYKILVDPFDDSPKWSLGVKFPDGIGANLVLFSETDPDHFRDVIGYQQNAKIPPVGTTPFPGLNLRGTVGYEFNGEPCLCWHYSIDGIRLIHFSDQSHVLNNDQLKEIGHPDIAFVSPPKTDPANQDALNIIRENIRLISPKLVIWSHYIAPESIPDTKDFEEIKRAFQGFLAEKASTNINYKDENSLIELAYIYQNALALNEEFSGRILDLDSIEINSSDLTSDSTGALLFRKMLIRENSL